ncbi:hypothetical protein [Ralstonia pseudosolanacearum]|uniref:hypothetical protein n=1 Tax=Ralstonia pseudosolanacearum TaxID=1310165 RepID=UPI0026750192|nr:hypothetical protein [Ralstonia pseudosolanacearum]MDO3547178.1 hypothetical protein [Ralstonia pseudosolanacearum]MDO3582006.1 hypothetical protein [Ralstonia pseudosolanacearum]
MNHSITSAERSDICAQSLVPGSRAVLERWRRAVAECAVFEMPIEEFLDDLFEAACGARRQDHGSWKVFGDISVCHTKRADSYDGIEEAWHRWLTPSLDGRVRGLPMARDEGSATLRFTERDNSAPWVARSPTSALLWVHGDSMRRVTLGQLLGLATEHGLAVGGAA